MRDETQKSYEEYKWSFANQARKDEVGEFSALGFLITVIFASAAVGAFGMWAIERVWG